MIICCSLFVTLSLAISYMLSVIFYMLLALWCFLYEIINYSQKLVTFTRRCMSCNFSVISAHREFSLASDLKNSMDLRFRHNLTHENGHNSLNFWDRGLIFWTFSYLYVFKKSYFATLAVRLIFKFSLKTV